MCKVYLGYSICSIKLFRQKCVIYWNKATNLEKYGQTGNIAEFEGYKIHELERNHHMDCVDAGVFVCSTCAGCVLSTNGCEYHGHVRVSPQTPRDPPNFRDCHYAPGIPFLFLRVDRYLTLVVFIMYNKQA